MCKIKDNLLHKIFEQIEEKKAKMGNPTIHTFPDGSAIVNFFDCWDDYIVGTKRIIIKKVGIYPDNKNLDMIFSSKGTHMPLHDFDAKKTYVLIRGKINFFFEDDDDLLLTDFSTMVLPKGKIHGGDTLEDSFVLIIEDQCECESPMS